MLIQLWRSKFQVWYKNNGEGDTASASAAAPTPLNATEVPMEWQRATRYQYSFSSNVPNRKEKLFYEPKTYDFERYDLHALAFNPSAELARVYESIVTKANHRGGAVSSDMLIRSSSWVWVTTGRNPILGEVKEAHNELTDYIADYIYKWISVWGEIEDQQPSKRHLFMINYMMLAEQFHGLYTKILTNAISQKDKDVINENIRLHCDVGISDDGVGIQPKNLLGYLWVNLADDVFQPKWHKVCNREGCWRVAGTAVRADWKWCGNSCASYMAKTPKAKRTPSMFDESKISSLQARIDKSVKRMDKNKHLRVIKKEDKK